MNARGDSQGRSDYRLSGNIEEESIKFCNAGLGFEDRGEGTLANTSATTEGGNSCIKRSSAAAFFPSPKGWVSQVATRPRKEGGHTHASNCTQ